MSAPQYLLKLTATIVPDLEDGSSVPDPLRRVRVLTLDFSNVDNADEFAAWVLRTAQYMYDPRIGH